MAVFQDDSWINSRQEMDNILGNSYFQKFLKYGLKEPFAVELAQACLDTSNNPEDIFCLVAKLKDNGYNESKAFSMILGWLKSERPLSDLEQMNVVPAPPNAVALMQSAPNQTIQMGRSPDGEFISRVMDPAVAGISFKQAQSENYAQIKDARELSKRQKEIDQDLYKQKKQNEEEERHTEAMLKIKVNANTGQLQQPFDGNQVSQVGIGSSTTNLTPIDYVEKFVAEKHVVREKKIRDADDVVLYIWDDEEHIYRKINQQRLSFELQTFWPEKDIPNDSKIDQFIKLIRYRLSPFIDESGLKIADGNQTFFPNGYFDIKLGVFCHCDTSEWLHNFCIPYEYDEDAPDPVSFDQILQQLFDGDETKINLAYQIIGALVSEVRSLKEIYVFQGVTNSGKTTLASIILKLFDKHERKKLNSVKDITDDALKTLSKSVRVVCIKDSGQEALRVNSVSYLKSYASGDFDEDEIYFTILLQTNNAIYSDKSGNIEKALHDRFLILPFAKNMRTTLDDSKDDPISDFIDNHFEDEKHGIVKKALFALHEVIADRKRFVHRFPLNGCVGTKVNVSSSEEEDTSTEGSDEKSIILQTFIETNFDVIDSAIFQDTPTEGISARRLVTIVSKELPDHFRFATSNSLGKVLKKIKIADKSVEIRDSGNNRYYNLKQKEPLTITNS